MERTIMRKTKSKTPASGEWVAVRGDKATTAATNPAEPNSADAKKLKMQKVRESSKRMIAAHREAFEKLAK